MPPPQSEPSSSQDTAASKAIRDAASKKAWNARQPKGDDRDPAKVLEKQAIDRESWSRSTARKADTLETLQSTIESLKSDLQAYIAVKEVWAQSIDYLFAVCDTPEDTVSLKNTPTNGVYSYITPDTTLTSVQQGDTQYPPAMLSSLLASLSNNAPTYDWESSAATQAYIEADSPGTAEQEVPLRFEDKPIGANGQTMTRGQIKSANYRMRKRETLRKLKEEETDLRRKIGKCRPFSDRWGTSIHTLCLMMEADSDGLHWSVDRGFGEDRSPEQVWVSYHNGGGGPKRLDEMTAAMQEMVWLQSAEEAM